LTVASGSSDASHIHEPSACSNLENPGSNITEEVVHNALWSRISGFKEDGEYVVTQFETPFENKKSAAETVTPLSEAPEPSSLFSYFYEFAHRLYRQPAPFLKSRK
jgi:hypothetical protein